MAAKNQAVPQKAQGEAQAEERTNIDELLEKTDIPDKYKDIMKKIDELQKSITNKLDNIDTIKKNDRFFKNLYEFQGDFENKINSLKKKYKYYNNNINWEIIFVNTSPKDTTINKLTEKVYKDSSFIYDNNYNYLIINIKKLLENYEESNKMELSNVIMKKIGQGGLDNKKEELILVCIKEIEKYYNIYEKKEEEKKEEEKDEKDEKDKNIIGKCYMLFIIVAKIIKANNGININKKIVNSDLEKIASMLGDTEADLPVAEAIRTWRMPLPEGIRAWRMPTPHGPANHSLALAGFSGGNSDTMQKLQIKLKENEMKDELKEKLKKEADERDTAAKQLSVGAQGTSRRSGRRNRRRRRRSRSNAASVSPSSKGTAGNDRGARGDPEQAQRDAEVRRRKMSTRRLTTTK